MCLRVLSKKYVAPVVLFGVAVVLCGDIQQSVYGHHLANVVCFIDRGIILEYGSS